MGGFMWHGNNLKEILKGVDAEKAFRKPAAGAHNIYELVMHMYCWRNFVYEHSAGNADYKVELNSIADWPVGYEETEANWNNALQLLEKSQSCLVEVVSKINDEQLNESMHGRKFTWYHFLHGVIEHDIYHSAQISMLKK